MNLRALPAAIGWLALVAGAGAVNPRERTDSGQFTIYCEDAQMRRQVASFAARTKSNLLALLGESDAWKRPIVITIQLDTAPNPAEPPATLRLVDSVVGMKIEVVVRLGREPLDVNLPQHLIRAVLLEYMYRGSGLKEDGNYAEPPWWFVEGAAELLRRRDGGAEPRFFRSLIETNKLPPIESFLAEKPDELGPTALAVDRALALCLVQLLLEQTDGRRQLASLLRTWPEGNGDSLAALAHEFPAFRGGAPALQKWWTLNLAHAASADRFLPLASGDTDRQIAALLEFDIPQKDGSSRHFAIENFTEYLKMPMSRPVLAAQRGALVALSVRANVLLRPVLAEYEECLAQLSRGKTRGIRDRLEHASRMRAAVGRRAGEIADYLNWFEATQMGVRSTTFDNYLKTANEVSAQEKNRRAPIAQYLDQLEREY
jgi:hypothetical protein